MMLPLAPALLLAAGLALGRPAAAQVFQGSFTNLLNFTGTGGSTPGATPEGITLAPLLELAAFAALTGGFLATPSFGVEWSRW